MLDLLRDGLTNGQIAARLGIAERTAKFHVSEIIGKLAWRAERKRPSGIRSSGSAGGCPQVPAEFGPYGVTAVSQQPFADHLIAVAWVVGGAGPGGRLSVFSSDGTHMETFRLADSLHHVAWASESMLATNIGGSEEQLRLEVRSGFVNWILP